MRLDPFDLDELMNLPVRELTPQAPPPPSHYCPHVGEQLDGSDRLMQSL